ncbi:MAG: hypothetical protein FJX68_03585 [Alphaproteobacteria bacterium]|nr:hypothetical protein [Alphaproteobacteria bacterium]
MPAAPPAATTLAPAAPPAAEPGLQRQALGGIDLSGLGTLGQSQGALPPSLWRGTTLRAVEQLLVRLPLPSSSPAMVDLARRLLLSTAEAPAGQPSGVSLLALRAERLWAAGLVEDLVALARLLPQDRAEEPALAKLRLEAAFVTGDEKTACAIAEAMLARDALPVWQKAAAFCYARAGDQGRANLFADMLRETQREDQTFFRLLEANTGRRGKPPEWPKQSEPLHLAMLRATGRLPPLDRLEALGPAALAAAAVAGDNPPEIRAEAAERAAALVALRPTDLAKAYAEATFGAADRADPAKRAKELGGGRGSALLVQAAALQPAGAAGHLAEALRLAREGGRFLAVGAALLPGLRQLAAEPGTLPLAADAVRLLALADDPVLARRWHDMMPAGEVEAARLLPLVALAGNAVGDLDGERFAAWWQAQPDAPAGRKPTRLAILLACWQGLGHAVPAGAPSLALELAEATEDAVAPLGLRQALRLAAEQKRLGETVALALIVLGSGGPAKASATSLQAVLEALRAVGLQTEARHLALEALVAHSF